MKKKTEEALISLLVFPIRRKYQKEGSVYLSAPKSEDKDLIRQKESDQDIGNEIDQNPTHADGFPI